MEIITKYPELARYIQRTEDGALTIANEGWDFLIKDQEKKVNNA
jgi:hypothetical protein